MNLSAGWKNIKERTDPSFRMQSMAEHPQKSVSAIFLRTIVLKLLETGVPAEPLMKDFLNMLRQK